MTVSDGWEPGTSIAIAITAVCGAGPDVVEHAAAETTFRAAAGSDVRTLALQRRPAAPSEGIKPNGSGPRDPPEGYYYRYSINDGPYSAEVFTTATGAALGDVGDPGDTVRFQVRALCQSSPLLESDYETSPLGTIPFPPTATHTATATATSTSTAIATSTFTATPTATPVPEIIVALLDADDVLLPEMGPGVYMIVHGNPVTVRATFRFFLGDHRFNMEMAPTDGSALDGAACYGPGMLSVRTFNSTGEDVVETGRILASCPTGEYQVIVNQADGASARGVDRPIFVPTKVARQTPPTFTATLAVGGTRAVNLSAVGAEYDAFVYRISGGGIVSEWLPLEDIVFKSRRCSVPISPSKPAAASSMGTATARSTAPSPAPR